MRVRSSIAIGTSDIGCGLESYHIAVGAPQTAFGRGYAELFCLRNGVPLDFELPYSAATDSYGTSVSLWDTYLAVGAPTGTFFEERHGTVFVRDERRGRRVLRDVVVDRAGFRQLLSSPNEIVDFREGADVADGDDRRVAAHAEPSRPGSRLVEVART